MDKRTQGFDRYLEFQFSQTGSFFTALFNAIKFADPGNLLRLNLAFPYEVEAYLVYTRISLQDFLARCSEGHPLIARMQSEYETRKEGEHGK